jgi:hypothetical protein
VTFACSCVAAFSVGSESHDIFGACSLGCSSPLDPSWVSDE